MKQVANPPPLLRLGISKMLRVVFIRQGVRAENKAADSIFSLACQRCAGFTTRPPERKENDW
jgi:hypothetical protein